MGTKDFWSEYRTSDKVYLPAITRVRWVKRFAAGPYQALLGTDCESAGLFKYHHILSVFSPGIHRPRLVVASEYDVDLGDPLKPFFTIYFGGVHFNQGASPAWQDLAQFELKALASIQGPLQLAEPTQELPLEDPGQSRLWPGAA